MFWYSHVCSPVKLGVGDLGVRYVVRSQANISSSSWPPISLPSLYKISFKRGALKGYFSFHVYEQFACGQIGVEVSVLVQPGMQFGWAECWCFGTAIYVVLVFWCSQVCSQVGLGVDVLVPVLVFWCSQVYGPVSPGRLGAARYVVQVGWVQPGMWPS